MSNYGRDTRRTADVIAVAVIQFGVVAFVIATIVIVVAGCQRMSLAKFSFSDTVARSGCPLLDRCLPSLATRAFIGVRLSGLFGGAETTAKRNRWPLPHTNNDICWRGCRLPSHTLTHAHAWIHTQTRNITEIPRVLIYAYIVHG